MLGFRSSIRDDIKLPSNEEWVQRLDGAAKSVLANEGDTIRAGFDKVFSNTEIGMTKETEAAYNRGLDLFDQLSKAKYYDPATRAEIPVSQAPLAQREANAAMNAEGGLGADLWKYMTQIKERVLNPAKSTGTFPMAEMNNFIHFIAKAGTSGEEGMESGLQMALRKDVTSSLQDMGKVGETKLAQWTKMQDSFTKYAEKKVSDVATVFQKYGDPTKLAEQFLNGGILKDKSDVAQLESLVGPLGVGQVRSQIMHTALSNAIDMFKDITSFSTPEEFDAAEKAAGSELQKFLDVAGGKINMKPTGSGFQALSSQQMNWIQGAKQFITGFNMKNIAKGFGLPDLEALGAKAAETADTLERGRATFEAAKTPSALATSISKLTNIDDIKAVMSFVKSDADKAAVGAQIIKNFVNGTQTAFRTVTTPEGFSGVVDKILNIGGNDMKAAYDEIFGKGTATDNLLRSMDEAASAFKAFSESKTPAALERLGNAAAGVLFYTMGHPIMASGFAIKTIRGVGGKEAENVFQDLLGKSQDEILAQMEKDGSIVPSKVAKLWRALGTFLKNQFTQKLGAEAVSSAGNATINPDQPDETQPDFSTLQPVDNSQQ